MDGGRDLPVWTRIPLQLSLLARDINTVQHKSTILVRLLQSINSISSEGVQDQISEAWDHATISSKREATHLVRQCLSEAIICRQKVLLVLYADSVWPVEQEKQLSAAWSLFIPIYNTLRRTLRIAAPLNDTNCWIINPITENEPVPVQACQVVEAGSSQHSMAVQSDLSSGRSVTIVLPEGIDATRIASIECVVRMGRVQRMRNAVEATVVVTTPRAEPRQSSPLGILPSTSSMMKLFSSKRRIEPRLPRYDELILLGDEKDVRLEKSASLL